MVVIQKVLSFRAALVGAILVSAFFLSFWQIQQAFGYGGGGGGSPAPTVSPSTPGAALVVVINKGAATTGNTSVSLNVPQASADQMAVSNRADFSNAAWQPYDGEFDWTLEPGDGTKTVYVKFRDSSTGKSTTVYTGSIQLVSAGQVTPPVQVPASLDEVSEDINKDGVIDEKDLSLLIGQQSESCPLDTRMAYKTNGSRSVYYVTLSCTKRPFNNPRVFFSYFSSWNDVKITTEAELSKIPADALGFMPWGSKYDPKYGALVKTVNDPKVYLLLNGNKHWITSEQLFATLGYKWEWVEDIADSLLDKYVSAGEITVSDSHPNGTLVKYANSAKVYRLVDGKKSHVTNQAVFERLGYRLDRIVVISDSETYEDGPDIQ